MEANIPKELAGRKILFADFPADGHFNPLTGLAVYLKEQGCDVRWYASSAYAARLKKLQIKHYPFKLALDPQGNDLEKVFPDRYKIKTQVARLKYDIIHAFILRSPEYYEDILDIYETFPFDLLVADNCFTGIPFVKELMKIPVVAIGVLPLTESSRDLPPSGLGKTPSYNFFGRLTQSVMRKAADQFIFREPNQCMWQLFDQYNIPHDKENVFDMLIRKSDLLLQSGTPGFEYERSDLSGNIRFIGPLLPHSTSTRSQPWFDERLNRYSRIVLVTQGTVEKDVRKIIVPALEAYKDSDTLVIATTGGFGTAGLKQEYPQDNFIIADFIPFNDIMPYVDVYVTNGGYGGVMISIENNVPMVVAGVHEGKNEICARVGYFGLGIDLRTETPTPLRLRKAVNRVMGDQQYRNKVAALREEFSMYHPHQLAVKYMASVLKKEKTAVATLV